MERDVEAIQPVQDVPILEVCEGNVGPLVWDLYVDQHQAGHGLEGMRCLHPL